MVVWVQFVVIDDVGSVGMDECVEAQSIPPTGAEVLNINTGISVKIDILYHYHHRFTNQEYEKIHVLNMSKSLAFFNLQKVFERLF